MDEQTIYYKLQVFWHVKETTPPLSGNADTKRKASRAPTQILKEVLADPTKPLRPAHTPRQTLNQCEEIDEYWLSIRTTLPPGLKRNDKATRKAERKWLIGLWLDQHPCPFIEFVGDGARVQLVEVERPGVIAAWTLTKGAWTREMPEWKLAVLDAPRTRRNKRPKTRLL